MRELKEDKKKKSDFTRIVIRPLSFASRFAVVVVVLNEKPRR